MFDVWYVLFAALWWTSGVASFIYWWTTEYDFGLAEVLPALMIGTVGPVAWPMGWIFHGEVRDQKVLIKRRK